VRTMTAALAARSREVEAAVADLLALTASTTTATAAAATAVTAAAAAATNSTSEAAVGVARHYHKLLYQSVRYCVQKSLEAIKVRACSRVVGRGLVSGTLPGTLPGTIPGTGIVGGRPFFEVDIQLSVPSVRLNPR
jgi:dynein heavy chain, axonemal